MKYLIIFILLLSTPVVYSEIVINEVMYNPDGNDNNNEYIELIDEDVIDLTNYTLEDLKSSDELELLQDKSTRMALIVEEGFDFTEVDVTIYTTGATIGNNLNNDKDLIILKDPEGDIVEAITYHEDMGADGNGMSLCRLGDMILRECVATPGMENEEGSGEIVGLRINEFLANPLKNESEWVELYYSGEEILDLEGLVFEDKAGKNKTITNVNVEGGDTNIEEYLVVFWDDGFLNDDGDGIFLKNNGHTINSVSYDICEEDLSWSYYDGGWFEDWDTKGEENVFVEEVEYDYSELEITEFMANPEGDDDAEMPGGEWIELYNFGDEIIDVTGLVLEDFSGRMIYISDVNVEESTMIGGGEYLVVYMNGFWGFLNNDDLEVITLRDGMNVIDELSYGFSSEGVSWSKISEKWIQSKHSKGTENIYDEGSLETSLEIKKIYTGSDDKVKFGEYIRVKVEIVKGDTGKYNVEAYVADGDNKLGKTSKISVYSKFINYSLVVPVNMPDNCDGSLEDGFYTIVIEGLDEKEDELIKIEGLDSDSCTDLENSCEEIECKETVSYYEKGDDLESNINNEEIPLTSLAIFESKGEKSTDIGKYLFVGLLIFLLVLKIKWLSKSE